MRIFQINEFILEHDVPNPVLFDGDDIKHAMKYTCKRVDSTGGDVDRQRKLGVLLGDLRDIGAPDDCDIHQFVNRNWFQSLPMWMTMQRDIHYFQMHYADRRQSWYFFRRAPKNVTKPLLPEPPTITNFAAIPLCSFQRRHIYIDTTVLHLILSGTKLVPQKKSPKTGKPINFAQNDFLGDKPGAWSLCFDMDKINSLVKHKKQFGFGIMTDGVSSSVLFDAPPQQPAAELNNEELLERYDAGEFFYLLGIDPGERTYNATMRRTVSTGVEVRFEQNIPNILTYC